MAVRFVDPDEEQVVLQCPEPHCVWTKRLWRDGVVASLRGHYGYQHPERRLPENREARWAAGLA
jgi:hypothetical protein